MSELVTATTEHEVPVSPGSGVVTGILMRPAGARCLYVFGHGAGAGMRHVFMQSAAEALAHRGVATFRYNFPYMEAGRKPPNRAPVLMETVRASVAFASALAPDLPLIAGGKSMGGRMTSMTAATEPLPGVVALAFFGFPLHAPGREGAERGAHLEDVGLPMLFLQGTRDKLANLDLFRPLLDSVEPTPMLHVVDGADHGFHVLKRSGRTDEDVMTELGDGFEAWFEAVTGI